MALSERSRHIFDLWMAYRDVNEPLKKKALGHALQQALSALIDVQLPAIAHEKKLATQQLKAEFLISLGDEGLLHLCEQLTPQTSARELVTRHLMAFVERLQTQASTRDAENARLVKLLRAYRNSGQGKPETAELYRALQGKMRKIAENLAYRYSLPSDDANEVVDAVIAKWLEEGGLLHDWCENGRSSISTWLYQKIDWRMLDLKRKAQRYKASSLDERNQEGELEAELIDYIPSEDKTQHSIIRGVQLKSRFDGLVDKMTSKPVLVDGKPMMPTQAHVQALRLRLENPDITNQQLADELKISKASAGRRKLEVEAYIAAHPLSEEFQELLQPFGQSF